MKGQKLLPLLLGALFAAPAAQAGVDLIAIGSISGSYEDLSAETAATLENGVPGNRLGGLGSSITYAGCSRFLALPDRGLLQQRDRRHGVLHQPLPHAAPEPRAQRRGLGPAFHPHALRHAHHPA